MLPPSSFIPRRRDARTTKSRTVACCLESVAQKNARPGCAFATPDRAFSVSRSHNPPCRPSCVAAASSLPAASPESPPINPFWSGVCNRCAMPRPAGDEPGGLRRQEVAPIAVSAVARRKYEGGRRPKRGDYSGTRCDPNLLCAVRQGISPLVGQSQCAYPGAVIGRSETELISPASVRRIGHFHQSAVAGSEPVNTGAGDSECFCETWLLALLSGASYPAWAISPRAPEESVVVDD
jgi:hypothetical protein